MNKKFRLLALAMALVFVLCSCGSKSNEFSYSNGLDNDGLWKGVKATDYVTLPDLKAHGVTDAGVDMDIYYILTSEEYMKKTENTEREIENGDTVNIDYVGKIDGVPFDGGDTQGQGTEVTIGVTNYITGFLDQLIGHKAGETFDINVTFPTTYGNADLAGKPAVFTITVNALYDYDVYDLTDNFVAGMLSGEYGVTTVEELRKLERTKLIYDAVMNSCEFKEDIPAQIGEQYLAKTKHQMELSAQYYNMTLDQYVAAMYANYGISNYDDFKTMYKAACDSVAKEQLMMQAVAETNGLKVTQADLDALYKKTEESYTIQGAEFDKDKVIKTYGEPYIKQMALFTKVQDFLAEL